MQYEYLIGASLGERRLRVPRGQTTAGFAVGIIVLDLWYPYLPGNVANATTFRFPVRYLTIRGGSGERVFGADPSLCEALVAAGLELQSEGVGAVIGACGYLGHYQRVVADALDVPVFFSSLLQVPLICQSLKRSKKVGILCADSRVLDAQLLDACGAVDKERVVVAGMEDRVEFGGILYDRGEFEFCAVRDEMVAAASKLIGDNHDIGAILLECSDMPSFAAAVQAAVRLPVFDFITMINWVYAALSQRTYDGFC